MRTTLEIDDDLMDAARSLGRLRNERIGKTISDLARRGLVQAEIPNVEYRDGIPVWVHPPGAVPVTGALVRNLSEDE